MTTLAAMVNAHSHAFQRDLRGIGERSERADDDFWSWREGMYALAERLDPDGMREVAGRVYAEMAAAGYGAVGEFHYVHNRPDGTPYEDPNAMALAVVEAAAAAGLRIVLLPAAYARGGHARFRDDTVEAYLARVDALRAAGHAVGVAAHSVRAVPAEWLREIAAYAEIHGLVRHVHAHEQPRELEECEAEHGCSPIELLHRTGFLSERTTVVHGIHVSDRDVALVAETGTIVATCPTTEGNLGDGHFPALRYRDAGVRIAIGSDSNVIVDPFEELRELETGARRERRTRHALLAAGDLWGAVVRDGLASLGLDDAGEIAVDLDSTRLRGVPEEDVMRALATCGSADIVAPVRRVISSGSTFEEQIGYSRAVVDGDWVHVSGTTGFDYATMTISGDVVEQAEQCLRNVEAALAEAGCTFADVVRVRYLLPDREDFEPCWPALRHAFGAARPAATMHECGLSDPRMRIEIEVTARRGGRAVTAPRA
jgi:formimidoylglutamate deiminase